MAKLKRDPISSPDLLEYLESESDFGFELEVVKLVSGLGLAYEHSGLYEDPISNKLREFDIRVSHKTGAAQFSLAIECKNIREYNPVLVSCVKRSSREATHDVVWSRHPDEVERSFYTAAVMLNTSKTLRIEGIHSVYKNGELVGKSIAQVGRTSNGQLVSNDSEFHEKWGQALASLSDLIYESHSAAERSGESSCLSTSIPAVVVPDGALWAIEYSDGGERIDEPSLVERCSCFVGRDYSGPTFSGEIVRVSHLEIMTLSGLRHFIESDILSESGRKKWFPVDVMYDMLKSCEDDEE